MLGFKPTRARALVDAALQSVAPDDAAILLPATLRAVVARCARARSRK
jgi:hypothetical protein